ncbi:hypothetical protein E3C22_00830 [Jiella endophytica]|uniref:Uncharacterized protein n=1 Tax=Jiella endophytica TaxID=2558362 RepID=A0A4Y8RG08_9HYPH|nr:hypothetical protein [Jiella endophytica]TFF20758.1 hypothetical protein E3C22_17870 [Jiella endophytica]TFF27059.1 hypothetical protein E3C22_00830 [Jiella endophytica]
MPSLTPLRSAGIVAAALLLAAPASAQDAAAPAAPEAGAAAAPAQGKDASGEFSAAVEALSPLIQDVQVVGPWSDGDEHGVWRTVMVQPAGDNAGAHFFIQQLDASGHNGLSLRSTTEIPEIAKIDGQVVGYRADDPSETEPNSLGLFFEVVPSDGEISETYELHFTPGQPYLFGPASN